MLPGPLFPNWPFKDLEPRSYSMIMADPPWSFSLYSSKGGNKSADKHYNTMTIDDIASLPVGDLAAEHCVLWMWATAPMFPDQVRVAERWGFAYKTMGVWNKTTGTGKQSFGTGYILRTSHEPFIIATRGDPKTSRSIRSSFSGLRREHSRKPEIAYEIAEKLMPKGQRLELFSRKTRKGWSTWGDQDGIFDDGGQPEKIQLSVENNSPGLPF